jgi:hypothetical protein
MWSWARINAQTSHGKTFFYCSPPNTKSGNPNGRGLQNWPEFSPRTERVMYIGPTFEAGTMPDLPAHFLMDTYMNAKRAQ